MKKFLSLITVISLVCTFLPKVQASFDDAALWETYDPSTGPLSSSVGIHLGAGFDGQYVYFTNNGSRAMRYDTTKDLDTSSAWEEIDINTGLSLTSSTYSFNPVFDGRYVYYPPYRSTPQGSSGDIARFDTQDADGFEDIGSWTHFDPSANCGTIGCSVAQGFQGAVFDGRYVYFVPYLVEAVYNGEVIRYDTTQAFSSTAAWEAFYPADNGVGQNPKGYHGATFDGRYVYFSPYNNGTHHGEVLRYDTQGTFTAAGGWSAFDPGCGTNYPTCSDGLDSLNSIDADGYSYPIFDGRYVYFPPENNGGGGHSNMLRYDTTASFSTISSWDTYDPRDGAGISSSANLFAVSIYDGKYIYYASRDYSSGTTAGSNTINTLLQYDTALDFDDENAWVDFNPGTNGVGTDPEGYWGGVFADNRVIFSPYRHVAGQFNKEVLTFDTGREYSSEPVPLRPEVFVVNPRPGADSEYEIRLYPVVPITTGSVITLAFNDAYDPSFNDLLDTDIEIIHSGVSGSSISFDDTLNQISITLTLTEAINSPLNIIIGGTGGNQLANPSTSGNYGISISVTDNATNYTLQSNIAATIGGGSSSVGTTAIVSESLIMSLNTTSISLQVDPAVNSGEDLTEYTQLTVSSNASNGYSIYGKLDDGSGNAQLVNGANTIASGTGENNFGFEAKNATYDNGETVSADASFASSATLLNSNSTDIGLNTTTDDQDHTIYYDLNVDFTTPAGVYTGTLTYTVVASF